MALITLVRRNARELEFSFFHALASSAGQTFGRVAIIGGSVAVALANVTLFSGVEQMSGAAKIAVDIRIYQYALAIPVISVLGVMLAGCLKMRQALEMAGGPHQRPQPNGWILGGSLAFVVFTLTMGLAEVPYNQDIIFAGSFGIIAFLMLKLMRELEPDARFIAVIDTALESPLGQIAMIPMLAWIANSAPANLKAKFFAVMASFTNLALSLSQLGTKYLNRIFSVTGKSRTMPREW